MWSGKGAVKVVGETVKRLFRFARVSEERFVIRKAAFLSKRANSFVFLFADWSKWRLASQVYSYIKGG